MPLLFQYGSNCDAERFNGPSRLNGNATDLGRVQTVARFRMAFNKRSQTNNCAAADLIRDRRNGRRTWGVLYDVPANMMTRVREIEGGYTPVRVAVQLSDGKRRNATTYVVPRAGRERGLATSVDYVRHIVTGLRAHDVPDDYVSHVIDVALVNNGRAKRSDSQQKAAIEDLRRA